MASETGIKNPQSDLCDKAEGIATYTDLVFLDAEQFRNCGDDLFVSNAERAQMAATGLIEFAKISGQHQHGTEPVRGIGHCCKVSDEAAFCLIQRPYISKTLLTRRISPRGSP